MPRESRIIKDRLAVIGNYCQGKSVLDLGCTDYRPDGNRKYTSTGLHLYLKDIAASLTGVDVDEEGVEQMRREGFHVVSGDVETLDLDRQFDCVVAGELLEHLSNPGLFLENMHRHLKDSGCFILTVPNAFGITSVFRILRRGEIKVHGEHTCWFDPKTLTTLLVRHGFRVERLYFFNKRKWYRMRYFYKMKYQVPKFLTWLRPYFGGNLLVVARKADRSISKGKMPEER
ncbi:MAG: class I SAM-dependent methyltransferase [bacterium]|nr:class I SAM-dependent methyltransferase [bacterium]